MPGKQRENISTNSLKNSFKSTKGSFSIEGAIIFPFLLMVIVGLLYITFMLYLKASTQALTEHTVRRGIKVWDESNKDINTGKIIGGYQNNYGRSSEAREELFNNWMLSKLDTIPLLHKIGMDTDIQLKNYLLYKKLYAEISVYFKVPFNISDREYIKIKSSSGAILINPVDFVRNADFIAEVATELEQEYKSFSDLMNGLRDIIKKIIQDIERLGAGGL